ncbi:hypothetical protein RhiirB3_455932 [Rhizophagus irregularis]|nr:hypothetical protein RhiirB3_455932 [Rhizophagus irregularis]
MGGAYDTHYQPDNSTGHLGQPVGYIHARALPGIGEWKEWSLEKIEKIVKKRKIENPNPTFTSHTQSIKQ